jgi:DNA-binding response OmpR family regulator
MAGNATTVLSVGINPELVSLRAYVLQEAGFNVVSTLFPNEALAKIERCECGVLLLCYSLPRQVRRTLRKLGYEKVLTGTTFPHACERIRPYQAG